MIYLKRHPWYCGFVFFLFAIAAAYNWLIRLPEPGQDPYFICGYPRLHLIRINYTKRIVTAILGPPTHKKIKKKLTEYKFGQGQAEYHIKEGWIYQVEGWNGNIEIYFNTTGRVVGTNCGYG